MLYHGRRIDKRQAADSTIWVLCPSVHSQEVFYESLLNWQPDALFLPEAELTGIENVLPDPEITAERLALFLQIERDTGPGSSWRHAQVSIKLHRNAEALNLRLFNSGAERPRRWKSFSNDSRPAVMNAPHKSPLVDSSLSAAGLSIFIRGRRRCRFAWNFSATKSNRCASSISIRRLPCAICARSIFC